MYCFLNTRRDCPRTTRASADWASTEHPQVGRLFNTLDLQRFPVHCRVTEWIGIFASAAPTATSLTTAKGQEWALPPLPATQLARAEALARPWTSSSLRHVPSHANASMPQATDRAGCWARRIPGVCMLDTAIFCCSCSSSTLAYSCMMLDARHPWWRPDRYRRRHLHRDCK